MKRIENIIKKISLVIIPMLLSTLSFSVAVGGQTVTVDTNILDLFKEMFTFSRTMLLVVQILVTIITVIIMAWQVVNFITGQQVDLGKVIMYIVGGIAVVILVWLIPGILAKTKSAKNPEGATINIEQVVTQSNDKSVSLGYEIK